MILDRRAPIEELVAAGTVPKSAITVGFDILELITTGMYLNPLTVYREYIQNAADAVDEAKALGVMGRDECGRVDIAINPADRWVRIRDNGSGIDPLKATRLLTSIGASAKRRESARGFRGIGRLAGLAYCREIVFRTRNSASQEVFEMTWNGHALKEAFHSANVTEELQSVVADIVRVKSYPSGELPGRFFEVEIRGIVRHGNDALLDPAAVAQYLAQVAPVPFAPDFEFGLPIAEFLSRHEKQTNLHIHVCESESPIYRPHQNAFPSSASATDRFLDLETKVFEGVDGRPAAMGWILHHSYRGAIPVRAGIKGFRARLGNMQVGGTTVFEDAFPELRFNHWTVGEIHILDRRIVPNGRRDHFEQNIHLRTLQNQLSPVGRSIAKRCRECSVQRNALRALERNEQEVLDQCELLNLSTLSRQREKLVREAIRGVLHNMDHTLGRKVLNEKEQARWSRRVKTLNSSAVAAGKRRGARSKDDSNLAHLPRGKRDAYNEMIGLISECAPTPGAAKALISRILARMKLT